VTTVAPQIIERAARGERQAFAMLVELCYARGLRFAQHMLGNREDAEEALQDTFVRVHDNLSRFHIDTPFDPWFFRILANRCRTLAAKRKRHAAVIEYSDTPPDGSFEDRPQVEWRGEVMRAIDTLPDEQREAFLLRHVEEMSYEDMATITGTRAATLRMRVSRACEALRSQLQEAQVHG
jgi:RNA polymerase sigma-70 factor (ECF subfamily)